MTIKNNVLDVLMYLFDNFMDSSLELQAEVTVDELEQAGFEPKDIDKAFGWLEQLISNTEDQTDGYPLQSSGHRVFTPEERQRLGPNSLDFLISLEKHQIITPAMRELVLEQVLGLDAKVLSVLQFKRIILMVLMNTPGNEDAALWLESFIQDEIEQVAH